MNKNGFLKAGVAEFAKGSAAYINVAGVMKDQAEHEKLYNHSFPGAHSPNQLQDALLLEFKTASWTADAAGRFPFTIIVSNERTGHKMPSGSSDLRFMWLAVSAVGEDGTVLPVSLAGSGSTDRADDYSLAGASQDDAAILQNDVPKGSRIYRTVLVNAGRRQSLFQYDAVENIFDNRFDAGEIRKEGYYMAVPPGFSGKVQLQARLYYRGAPSSFAGRMKVPDFSPVLVAAQIKDVSIQSRHAQ